MAQDENSKQGEDSVLEWADAYQKYYKTGARCPKCSTGQSSRLLNGLCAKCWREEVMGIDTTAPEQDDEITRPGGLRDQFAMAVLPVLIESELEDWMKDDDVDDWGKHYAPVADDAYKWADAMLEARKK